MFLLLTGEMCTNTSLYFAILSSVLLWFPGLSLNPNPHFQSIHQLHLFRLGGVGRQDTFNVVQRQIITMLLRTWTAIPNIQSAEKDLKEMRGKKSQAHKETERPSIVPSWLSSVLHTLWTTLVTILPPPLFTGIVVFEKMQSRFNYLRFEKLLAVGWYYLGRWNDYLSQYKAV